ncbi:MAG TPA: VOC family protein, partial [Gemmatimonadaceae bacterium]|nr:VOC family protein [Gemmatimonadaceae bacterium]
MSGAEPTQPPVVRCEGVTPILRVRHLQTSIDHYVRVLGFTLAWNHVGVMASVSRDRADIMLCEGDQGNPGTWLWIGVDDTAALLAEYT